MSEPSENSYGNNILKERSIDDSGICDLSNESLSINDTDRYCDSLKNLNNRFARYIEHIQKHSAINQANKTLEKLLEIPHHQLENLKALYDSEILLLRDALDKQSDDMAAMIIKNQRLGVDKENMNQDLDKKAARIQELTESLNKSETENISLRRQINDLQSTKDMVKTLSDQLKLCQEQLENEVLLRTSSDNACLTYKEKLEFNEAVFKKELGALMTTYKAIDNKLSTLKNGFNSSNLLEQMEIARKNLREYLTEFRESTGHQFLDVINKAANSISDHIKTLSPLKSDTNKLKKDHEQLMMELEKMKASHIKLENQLSDLETLNENEYNRLRKIIYDLSNDKIDELDKHLQELKNFNSSFSNKLFLNGELILYRKMLESEESRIRPNQPNCSVPKRRRIDSKSFEDVNSRKIIKATRHNKTCALM